MPSIEIKLMQGPNSGRAAIFTNSPITFGRNPDNTIVIAMDHLSRHHGEIIFSDGKWSLINLSPNGTTINKRNITKKPRQLKNNDIIGVGNQTIFSVNLSPTQQTTTANAQQQHDNIINTPSDNSPHFTPEQAAKTKRKRIWIGIGIYLFVFMIILIVLSQLSHNNDNKNGPLVQLTQQQIAREVSAPLIRTQNDRKAKEQLDKAQEQFNVRRANPRALFEAHYAFRESLAYSKTNRFSDGLIQYDFKKCESELIDKLSNMYLDACAKLRAGQYKKADEILRQIVSDVYPDSTSIIHQNASAMLRIASNKSK